MVKVDVDLKEFNKAMSEYMQFAKKAPSEVINSKCYFIARNATFTTGASNKEKIRSELTSPSKKNPNVPLAAILVNKQLKTKGKKGLSGKEMGTAIKKFINKRISSINFLRSGWLPAIKILQTAIQRGDITFSKKFQPPVNRVVKQRGKDKGNAVYARSNTDRCYAEIENSVQGSNGISTPDVQKRLMDGLQAAVDKEVKSMRDYIERKYNEAAKKFNGS